VGGQARDKLPRSVVYLNAQVGAVWYLMLCSWRTGCCSSDLYVTTTVTSDDLSTLVKTEMLWSALQGVGTVATAFIAYLVFFGSTIYSAHRVGILMLLASGKNSIGSWLRLMLPIVGKQFAAALQLSPVRPKRQTAIPHVLQYSVDQILPHAQAHRPSPRDRNDEVRIENVLAA
jgi:hypothetical protein